MKNKFESMMAKTKKLTIAELEKEGEEMYAKKIISEDLLLDAFNNKKLKSRKLIRKAISIKKSREKKEQRSEAS